MSATEQTAGPAPTESDKPKRDGTEYVVLLRHAESGSEGRWDQIGPERVQARSAEEAISAVASKFATVVTDGTLVAVPGRSWNPVKVSFETVSRVKLENA